MRVRVSVIFVGVALVAWQCWRSLRVTVEEQGLRQQSAKILWGDVAAWFLEGDTVFFVAKDGTEIRFRLTWFRRSTDIWRYLLAKTPVSPRRYDVLGASLPLEP